MPDGETIWRSYERGEEPDWLRPPQWWLKWMELRLRLNRSLWIPMPRRSVVCNPGPPTGLRRLVDHLHKR